MSMIAATTLKISPFTADVSPSAPGYGVVTQMCTANHSAVEAYGGTDFVFFSALVEFDFTKRECRRLCIAAHATESTLQK